VATQKTIYSLVEHVRGALARLTDEETGQDLIEYAGIIVIIAAIITVLIGVGIPSRVGNAVSSALNTILK
jgi:Flp pilus assembly pilin Flp